MTPTTPTNPIDRWHRTVAAKEHHAIDDMLAEDVVFLSPALHAPQRGKAVVRKYLHAAMAVLNNDTFRYTGTWHAEHTAVLEFELKLGELDVNGVDIIRWNSEGLIAEFKVMIRPAKALAAVVAQMGAQLAAATSD